MARMIRPRRARRSFLRRVLPYGYVLALVLVVVAFGRYFDFDQPIRSTDGERVVVRDGDTLSIGVTDIRISGIDAPELSQTCREADDRAWNCGRVARAKLQSLIARGRVACSPDARDRFGRVVAVCSAEGVPDIGEAMVREGLATNLSGFGEGRYADAEAEARAAKRGIWRGTFEPPAQWRREHPRVAD